MGGLHLHGYERVGCSGPVRSVPPQHLLAVPQPLGCLVQPWSRVGLGLSSSSLSCALMSSPGRSCQHGAILVATSICAAPRFTPCVVYILIRYPSGSARCEPVPIPPWILATRCLDHHPCPLSSSSSSSSSSCFPFSRSLSGRYRKQNAFLP